jgi:hypothetical protein
MKTQNYWHRTAIGVARIGVSDTNANCYALWIGECLIDDQFDSPEDAAAKAHRKDFSSVSAGELFHGAYVPEDIDRWQQTPPEKQIVAPAEPAAPTLAKCDARRNFSSRPGSNARN